MSTLNEVGGPVADGLGAVLGDASAVARFGTVLSSANIAHATVRTAYASNAQEYSEAYDQQIRTSVGAVASTAAGTAAVYGTAVAGLSVAFGVGLHTFAATSGPILASLTAAATSAGYVTAATAFALPVVGIAAAYFGGRVAMAAYDAAASADVKEVSRRNYTNNIGGFSRLRQSAGF